VDEVEHLREQHETLAGQAQAGADQDAIEISGLKRTRGDGFGGVAEIDQAAYDLETCFGMARDSTLT